jgi:hypothetical protein
MSNTADTTTTTTAPPRYVCASIPAWREQARAAMARGDTLAVFLSGCHQANHSNARTAYLAEQAAASPRCRIAHCAYTGEQRRVAELPQGWTWGARPVS